MPETRVMGLSFSTAFSIRDDASTFELDLEPVGVFIPIEQWNRRGEGADTKTQFQFLRLSLEK